MWKEFHRKDVRSRRSATPKILSAKKFWSTCGPSHFIRPVTSIAGSVWGIVISICRPYSNTHRECERAPAASSAIPPRRYEEHEKFEQFCNFPLIIFCSCVNSVIHCEHKFMSHRRHVTHTNLMISSGVYRDSRPQPMPSWRRPTGDKGQTSGYL